MRNLKRALSLLLSSTMVLGMVVMGGSAAGYQDVDASNDNQEAIEVLQAVGIMSGVDDAGNFNPDGSLTRNEMAVVMAHLLNLDYDYYRGVNTFSDVPDWAAPYVAACVAEGVTAGIGNGLYGGDQQITAAQAGLMVMKALGYFQNQEDFGTDWQVATIRQASYINLFDKVNSDAESALTRGQVAQLVLNGLKAKMVDFTGDKGIQIGDVTVGYKAEYTPRTNAAAEYNTIDDGTTTILADNGQFYVQLGEELYNGDLELRNSADDFNRPARYWEYDGKAIGTYVKNELIREEYTTKVTGKDLYDLLGKNTVDNYDFYVSIDGVTDYDINNAVFDETSINQNNKGTVGKTGNGVLTQVFVDTNAKRVDISIINTYLAIASNDYNEKQDELSLDVYAVDKVSGEYVKTLTSGDDQEALDVSGEDFDIAEAAKDDVFMVTIADGAIQTMAAPKTLSAVEITSFKQGDSLTTDGTDYKYSTAVEYDKDTLERYTDGSAVNLKDMTYNVYLDAYGYVLGVVEVEKPDNYLFLTGLNGNYDNLANVTYEANAIFMDGTMSKITIDAKKSDFAGVTIAGTAGATINSWFTYSVNSQDVYTVDLVTKDAGLNKVGQSTEDRDGSNPAEVIDYKHNSTTAVTGNTMPKVYGNDETVYLTASIDLITTAAGHTDLVIDGVDSVAVGIDNVDIIPWDSTKAQTEEGTPDGNTSSGIYTLYDEDGYIIAMVVVGEDNGNSDSLVYVHSGSLSRESYDKTTEEWTWTRTVIIDGEEATLTEVDDAHVSMLNKMDENKWYRVRFNADGEVTSVRSDNIDDDSNGKEDDGRLDQDFSFDKNWDLYSYTGSVITAEENAPYAYVWNYTGDKINDAINTVGVDTVLYHEGFNSSVLALHNSGKTLYLTQANDAYIRFTDDTKVVFEQENKNEWTTEFWSGQSGVERAIKELRLDEASGLYDYEVSAVIEDGRATSIIIMDNTNNGDSGTAPSDRSGDYSLTLTGSTYTLNYRTGTYSDTDTDDVNAVLDMIMADLAAQGYSNFSISESSGTYTISAVKGNVTRSFTWNSAIGSNQEMVLITLNGKRLMVKTGGSDTVDAVAIGEGLATAANVGTYFYYENGGSSGYYDITDGFSASDDEGIFTTGYYSNSTTFSLSGWLNSGWSVTNAAAIPTHVKSGDTFDVILTRSDFTPNDQDWFDSLTWTVSGPTGITGSASLETAGDGSTKQTAVKFTINVGAITGNIDANDITLDCQS